MRAVGYLLLASLVLAAAQAVAAALSVILLIAIMVGVCRYPRETFGLLAMGFAFTLIDRQPFAAIALFCILGFVSVIVICRTDDSV